MYIIDCLIVGLDCFFVLLLGRLYIGMYYISL